MKFLKFLSTANGRVLRVLLGMAIIAMAITRVREPWSWVLAFLAFEPILAALFNFSLIGPLFHADLMGRPRPARPAP